MADERKVPAENFCQTLQVNVDNDKLSDKDFRQLVRNTLPIVNYLVVTRDNGGSERIVSDVVDGR